MTLPRAIAIFKNIHVNVSDNEKISAIETVSNMITHNSIYKYDMLNVIKYLVQKDRNTKAEAIKEFVRELENAIIINQLAKGDTKDVIIAEIQELVKEMVGDVQ